jgi:hypothetical protein
MYLAVTLVLVVPVVALLAVWSDYGQAYGCLYQASANAGLAVVIPCRWHSHLGG